VNIENLFEKSLVENSTGAFALLDSLVRNGNKYIFGYPGGAILPIYDELGNWEKQDLIKHILVRHEQAAAHAADAYARITGEVGVCFATSGPGATNLVTGIATAQIDSVPMVVVTGQVGTSFIGTDAFQEIDIFGITLPIIKHSYALRSAADIPAVVNQAFYIAKTGRPGPVLIDFPKDIGLEIIKNYSPFSIYNFLRIKNYYIKFKSKNLKIHQALYFLTHSCKPLLYVGGGAVISNAKLELAMLARYFKIPVTTTLKGKGAFDENNPLCLGMLGMHGTAYANFAVNECDLLIAVGARFDDRVTGKLDEFAANAKIIHIDIDPAEIEKNLVIELALIGDVKKVLQELLETYRNNMDIYEIKASKSSDWKQTALLQAIIYGVLSAKALFNVYLVNVLSKNAKLYKIYFHKDLMFIRNKIIQEILNWNINCFLSKNIIFSNKNDKTIKYINVQETLIIDGRFDELKKKWVEFSICEFTSITKTRLTILIDSEEKNIENELKEFIEKYQKIYKIKNIYACPEIYKYDLIKKYNMIPIINESWENYKNKILSYKNNDLIKLDWDRSYNTLALIVCSLIHLYK